MDIYNDFKTNPESSSFGAIKRCAIEPNMTQNKLEQFAVVFVLQIRVENDPRIVTRFETYLFTADTTDDAFQKAAEFVPRLDYRYRNNDGEFVTINCLGIHNFDRVEPDGDDYPGLVSSVDFVTPNGIEPSAFVSTRTNMTCDNQKEGRSGVPNLSQ